MYRAYAQCIYYKLKSVDYLKTQIRNNNYLFLRLISGLLGLMQL